MKLDKSSHINGLRRYERRDFQDEITYNSCPRYVSRIEKRALEKLAAAMDGWRPG